MIAQIEEKTIWIRSKALGCEISVKDLDGLDLHKLVEIKEAILKDITSVDGLLASLKQRYEAGLPVDEIRKCKTITARRFMFNFVRILDGKIFEKEREIKQENCLSNYFMAEAKRVLPRSQYFAILETAQKQLEDRING